MSCAYERISEARSLAERPRALRARARAAACGYAFRSLDGDDGYLFEVSDGARRAAFAAGAGTPYALNDARAASIARDKAFCAEVLRQAGVPVLPGRDVLRHQALGRHARARARAGGRAGLCARRDIIRFSASRSPRRTGSMPRSSTMRRSSTITCARVAREHFAILMQPYVRAPEHRVFVLQGAPLFSYRKQLPLVTGDGRSTLCGAGRGAAARSRRARLLQARARDGTGALLALDDVPAAGALRDA